VIRKSEQFASMEDLHSLDFEKLGEVRQGYVLKVVRDAQAKEELKKGTLKTITLEPTFMVVNTETLSLYQNENINSLVDSIPLDSLECKLLQSESRALNQQIAGHNYMTCFGVYEKKNANPTEAVARDYFCLESRMAAKNWIDAIKNFYRSTLRAALPNEDLSAISPGPQTSTVSGSNQFAQMRVKSKKALEAQEEQNEGNL